MPWGAPPLASRGAPDGPGPRLGRGRRRAVGVERGRRRRGRAPGAVGLVGRSSSSRVLPEPGTGEEPVGPAAPRVRPRQARSPAPGCTPPRRASTRPRSTAPSSATRCWRPGWTSYQHRLRYQTYDVTDLLSEGANAVGVSAGRRLVPRLPRLRAASGTSTATGPARSCSSRWSTPTAAADGGLSDGSWRSTPGAADPGRHLQGRDRRRPAGAARLVGGRVRRRAPGRRSSVGSLDVVHARRADRSAGPSHPGRCRRWRSSPRRRARRCVDFGQNLVGRLALRAARRARPAPRSPSGTPRCSSTASSAPGRCGRRRRPT